MWWQPTTRVLRWLDLKADDFTVQEEGQEQPVKAFRFHQPDQQSEQASTGATAAPTQASGGLFQQHATVQNQWRAQCYFAGFVEQHSARTRLAMRDAMIKFMAKASCRAANCGLLAGQQAYVDSGFHQRSGIAEESYCRRETPGLQVSGQRSRNNPDGGYACWQCGSFIRWRTSHPLRPNWKNSMTNKPLPRQITAIGLLLDALNSLARALCWISRKKKPDLDL